MGRFNLSYLDHKGKTSGVGFNTPDLTAGNIAATTALMDDVQTAVEAISLGALKNKAYVAVTEDFVAVAPANGEAMRTKKWLVTGVDSEGNNASMEIPCADLSLLPAGSGTLDIAAGVGLALKDALEAVWYSKQANPVTVNQIISVGRSI
jgi:hypothetical protein